MAESNLPVVNAIEELKETNVSQTRVFKNSISRLQSSIRTGLAMNRGEIASMHNTLMRAFNINEEMLELSKKIRMEEYERWLEEQRKQKQVPEKKPDQVKKDDSLLPLLGLGGLASIVVGIVASITDLDAAIKAVKLPATFRGIANTFDAIGDFFGKIKAIKLPELPKINLIDIEGKPYSVEKQFGLKIPSFADIIEDIKVRSYVTFDDFRKSTIAKFDEFKLGFVKRIDDIIDSIVKPIENLLEPLTTKFDAFKTSFVSKVDAIFGKIVKPITDLTDTITDWAGPKALAIKDAVLGFFDKLPRIDSIEFPKWAKELPQKIASLFGNADEGTGILGFFSKTFSFLEPVLKPIKMIVGTIMRPFTQFILTFIDFVTGFYEGFNAEDGTFKDKLLAGIEGGVKGVIKGFTEALDLIFFQIPAWIAEKLGFKKLSESLSELSITELVDPVWDAIKTFFKRLFDDPATLAVDMGTSIMSGIEDFLKSVLRSVLPVADSNEDWFSIKNLVSKAIPDSVYEYAGIDPKTGEIVQKIEPQTLPIDGAQVDIQSKSVEDSKSQGVGNVAVKGGDVFNQPATNVYSPQTYYPPSASRGSKSPQSRDVYADEQVMVF